MYKFSGIRLLFLLTLFLLFHVRINCTEILEDDPEIWQDSSRLKTLFDSAKYYSRIDPVLSKNLLHKLILISKNSDSSNLQEYYTVYGNASTLNGELNEALYYYKKALQLDQSRKDTIEQIRVYNNLNYLYLLTGSLDLSLQNAHEGARLLEIMNRNKTLPPVIRQFGNKSAYWVQSYFYSNIGQINQKVGNYNEALTNYKRALYYIEKSGDKTYQACVLNSVALTYSQLKVYDTALIYCQKAIAINKEIDNEYGIGLNYQTLGDIYAETEDIQKARSALEEGMVMLERSDDILAQSMTLLRIVGIKIKSKQYAAAQKELTECFEIFSLSNDLTALKECYLYQFKLDSAAGKNHEALENYIHFHELEKKIVDVKLQQRVAEIQTAYETDKKDKENRLLKSENEIQRIRISKARIVLLIISGFFILIFIITFLIVSRQRLLTKHKIIELKQKNLNQQMNPHFVFNCLTSIQSYIFHNDATKSIEYLSKFSKLMRKILESSQKQYLSVQDEIDMLNLYLNLESVRFKNKFDYQIKIDGKIDPIQFKIPSFLIQPFVENSIWHGIQNKEGKGRIDVNFSLIDRSIYCTIQDNGIGRDRAGQLKYNSISHHISLGTSITQTRMKLLKSLYGNKLGIRYIDLKDRYEHPSGTKVEIILPIFN
ncbi:MAG TPA: histidine kinase [Bacteroidales bacterium]|nr:histidine kinase [Bacteroidales bacterium]